MPNAPPDPSRHAVRNLLAAALLGFVLVVAFVAYQLHGSWQQTESAAEQDALRIALSLDNYLQAHFQAVDQTLAGAQADYLQRSSQGPLSDADRQRLLAALRGRLPAQSLLRASDAQGEWRWGDGLDAAQRQGLAGLPLFAQARAAAPGSATSFGMPLRASAGGPWMLPAARALRDAQGQFGGVVLALSGSADMAALFDSVSVGPHGIVALFDAQRRLLISRSAAPEADGPADPNASLQHTLAALDTGQQEGRLEGRSADDGQHRRLHYRRLGELPLYVLVGMASTDYLAPWRREAFFAVAFVCLFAAMGAVMCGMQWRAWRRRELALQQLQQSMAALRLSEERFRALTHGLPQMVWTSRPDGSAEFFSHHWTLYSGVDTRALLDEATRLALLHPDERAVLQTAWRQAIAEGRDFRAICRIRRHDGQWRVFDSRALPQRDAGGRIVAWVGSNTDITEARLAHDELLRAKQAADEASAAKSNFLATISHEIRTPLNGVLGFAHIGQRESTPDSRAALHFARIQSSGQLLLSLINDVLDFSKVEAGKLQLDEAPLSLHHTLAEMVVMMRLRAEEKGITLTLLQQPDCPDRCLGDLLRLQQVLMNLLSNAIKFTAAGGVTLQAGRDADWITFDVSDTGIGISDEQQARLFLPFEQADSSITRRFGGTGLGLAISARLVALMGGTIRVQSRLGEGSRFELRLPLRGAAAQPTVAGPATRPLELGGG